MNNLIVAGTGHRPDKLGGYTQEVSQKLYQTAFDWLSKNKPKLVISGMALGWDIELATAALDLRLPVLAAVPFIGQESKWPLQSQKNYKAILKLCKVQIVSEGSYAPYKMQIRNEFMVNKCNLLLALYNGDKSGGTYNCINYAEKRNIKIVNLYQEFKNQ